MGLSWKDMNEKQKQHKREWTHQYEKSKKGFLMRLYRNMKSRVNGVQVIKQHLYKGKYLIPKDEFYQWAIQNKDFHRLFQDYEASNYERKLAPSVDRVDSEKGYSVDNMEFVTMSENSRRGSISNWKKKKGES